MALDRRAGQHGEHFPSPKRKGRQEAARVWEEVFLMEIQEGTPRQYLSELARGLSKRAASDRGSERLFRYSQIRR